MTRLKFIKAEAIDARKNYSYGSSIREIWFKEPGGKESAIEISGNFPVRRGNQLGLVFDNKGNNYVAIVNFSTELYFNFVPEVERASYDPFPALDWFYRSFFRQKLISPYGSETVRLHKEIEQLVQHEISKFNKENREK